MISIGSFSANVVKEKIFVDDHYLKDNGLIYLSIDGRRQKYRIKNSKDKDLFINRIFAVARRNKIEDRLSKARLKNIWSSYQQQYTPKKIKTMPANKALTKITTRAKQLRKKSPGMSWKSAIKHAGVDYRAGRLGKAPKAKTKFRQTGTSDTKRDQQRRAKRPGKRKSSSGKTYYERRKNRSDVPFSLSGIDNKAIHQLNYLVNELKKSQNSYEILKSKKREKELTDPFHKKLFSRYPKYIQSLKKQISEVKKNIK